MDKIHSLQDNNPRKKTIERFKEKFSRNSWLYVIIMGIGAILTIVVGIFQIIEKK